MIKTAFYISMASLLLLGACKKKTDVGEQANYTGRQMVNFNNYMDDNGNFGYYKAGLQLVDSFVNVNIEIKLSNTTSPALNDITIYLTKVDALVSDYNTVNGTSLEAVSGASPAVDFDFSKPIILKKGSRIVTIPMRVNGGKLDVNKQNALGIAILKVEGAELNAGEESKLVIEFGTKNKYDGVYNVTGTFVDTLNITAFTSALPTQVYLITTGANSVSVNRVINGSIIPAYTFLNAGANTYYGNWGAVFNFDPATDVLTSVTNYYGQGTNTQGRSGMIDPTGNAAGNKFYSSNHSIKAKYFMMQPNATTIRAKFNETYTYVGPR